MILPESNRLAFPLAKPTCDHGHMTYEPDTDDAQLFARHKRARQTIKETRKPVMEAAERAIRTGATNQELSALTGLTAETFRTLAEKIGVDNRVKPPTVGREVEAAKATRTASTHPIATEEFSKPAVNIRNLVAADTAHLAQVAAERAPERAAYYDHVARTSPYGYYSVVEVALKAGDLKKSDLDS
jgi:hypothetical protein